MSGLLFSVNLVVILQTTQATLTGIVADAVGGEPVRDAVVSLPDLNRTALTDAGGRYVFRSVPAGPQHVSVRRIGYQPRTLHAILPGAGELSINIALQRLPARLSEVRVLSPPEIRGVEPDDKRPFGDRRISAAAIRNHPMLAEADGFLALGGGEVQMRPESPSGINIRGGASDQASYLLDGIPILSPYHAAGTFSAVNTDALERLEISAAFPPATFPDALSGVVNARTRAPGSALQLQGGMSTTHSRITMDGPIGSTGLGYLVSYRVGYPVNLLPRKEASLVTGETGDIVAKLEGPLFGGRAKLLGFDASNEFGASATAEGEATLPHPSSQNDYSWKSRTIGLQWRGGTDSASYEVRIWSAASSAGMIWHTTADTSWKLASERADMGLFASAERRTARGAASVGTWLRAARTNYESALENSNASPLSLDTETPVGAIFARTERSLGHNMVASVGLTASTTFEVLHLNPAAMLTWSPSPRASISGSVARLRQYTQSLRNPESAVSNIFPADLFVGAKAPGVPVARADQAAVAVAFQPGSGQRVGVQLFARDIQDVVLVAPRTGEPFATDGFAAGSGIARGAALEWAMTRPRYGLMASYGVQFVRMKNGAVVYTPENGTSHVAEAGIIAFPSNTLSLRVGASLQTGRRTSSISGAFEWEACNLLDKGCEFGGSPRYAVDSLGKRRLPLYARLDIGIRKHWHLRVAGRDTPLAVYGSMTNVIDRANIMTFARDATTGQMVAVTMRPRSPLVLGIDWRY